MRRFILISLLIVLGAVIAARLSLPEPEAVQVLAPDPGYGYNILDLDLPLTAETAGSAMIAEMNGYYFFRTPTAKNALTGTFRGKNLLLICADSWNPDPTDRRLNPGVYRLWKNGARFDRMYRPDWYQGTDGREFALLSGLVPTRVNDETALRWTGEQGTFLPFTLARCLGAEGYHTLAFIPGESRRAAYEALGFSAVTAFGGNAEASVAGNLDYLSGGPFFAFYLWEDRSGESALTLLLDALEDAGHGEDTVICLLTGNTETYHAQLFLWAGDMPVIGSSTPCSELDVTPTLLNLFGAEYDSRFLSGLDVFAGNAVPGEPSAVTPLVTLYGTAYSDWITDAGNYIASRSVFWPGEVSFADEEAMILYVQKMCDITYDRYVFARRVMEYDYFLLVPGV